MVVKITAKRQVTFTKKRELIGNFKNQGTTWERSPQAFNAAVHGGIAIPYGSGRRSG